MACLGNNLETLKCARALTEEMFTLTAPGDLYARPLPQRNRLIFYVGHLEAFDWNLLRTTAEVSPPFAPELDRLFAFGIDPEPGQLPHDKVEDWPGLTETSDYCARVRELVDKGFEQAPDRIRHVAIEHRLMHAETLAYMLHNLPAEQLIRPGASESADVFGLVRPEAVRIPAGTATLGRCPQEGFGWDNEFVRNDVHTDEFLVDRWKVTNSQYEEFVRTGAAVPHYWRKRSDGWYLRRMFDEIPLPPDWPVWVTQEQAAAYARWCGGELPSEAQWHRAAFAMPDGSEREYPWGDGLSRNDNFDSLRWDPEPVTAHTESASGFGVEGVSGNGWEWTSSPFAPFPGFQPFPFYPGYSVNFFDDDHYVLKGASPRTDGVFLRRSFRNWFRKDYPYVFATFRCTYPTT